MKERTNDIATNDNGAQQNNVLTFSTKLERLRETVDPHLVRQRTGRRDRNGNVHMVEYVEWHTVADILDEYASDWSHSVKDIRAIGDIITVTVAITIDGITREGVGTGKTASETGIKKAEHDALKRAAVKFGIARELYKKEFDELDDNAAVAAVPEQKSSDPRASTFGDMISAKQLGMIHATGREHDVDVEAVCREKFGCSIKELSKRSASSMIDHLQVIVRSAPVRRAS